MSRQEELNRLINNIASDLEGFMGASVVDVETGMSLASVSTTLTWMLPLHTTVKW